MKIKWVNNSLGQSGFKATAVEYDALLPVDTLWMDKAPQKMNPEREAIAAYLAFGEFASGEFELYRKMGPTTATAMVADSEPTQLFPQPIEYYPKPLPLGLRKGYVGVSPDILGKDLDGIDAVIAVLPSDQWNGSMTSHKKLAVASNGFLIDALNRGGIRARLAVAVLFAEDLNIDSLLVPGDLVPDEQERKALEDLLLACRLGLQFI